VVGISTVKPALKVHGAFAYPEIRGPSIEVQHECLCWCANLDWTEVLGIILLVFRRHLTDVRVTGTSLLASHPMGFGLASMPLEKGVVTCGCFFLHLKVWTRHGGLKAPLLEKEDIGLETGSLIIRVLHTLDPLQTLEGRHGG